VNQLGEDLIDVAELSERGELEVDHARHVECRKLCRPMEGLSGVETSQPGLSRDHDPSPHFHRIG